MMLRYENPEDEELEQKVRKAIVSNAILAAKNDCIGYDQYTRETFWNEVSKVDYNIENLTTNCNTDCAAFVCTILKIVGHQLDIDELKNIPLDDTRAMENDLTKAGFKAYKESKYLTSPDELQPGDILLNTIHHTEIFVGDGRLRLMI